ncbi:hypothetical protein PROFUN_06160 [Planoprotostelium fungivorum]|uniref:F-box domain-containing protein n=1 Tax=Planoprotostelium fungivorum TaxID=1890364 RepID=A0A2P6NPL2_9EUKA|nr:hypothetical protein PROFUN_06160 [Planoprotostelium fungivorum]
MTNVIRLYLSARPPTLLHREEHLIPRPMKKESAATVEPDIDVFLPLEVIEVIMSNINDYETLYLASICCRSWMELSYKHWRRLFLEKLLTDYTNKDITAVSIPTNPKIEEWRSLYLSMFVTQPAPSPEYNEVLHRRQGDPTPDWEIESRLDTTCLSAFDTRPITDYPNDGVHPFRERICVNLYDDMWCFLSEFRVKDYENLGVYNRFGTACMSFCNMKIIHKIVTVYILEEHEIPCDLDFENNRFIIEFHMKNLKEKSAPKVIRTSFKGREGICAFRQGGFPIMYVSPCISEIGSYDLHTKQFLIVSKFLEVSDFCQMLDLAVKRILAPRLAKRVH